ncbi:MAG: hypothetical protein GXY34_00090 [Syntrophomonadaceae bacterium]|nr:hypothetical protein [Syntrophomonadaceae bacterium]
MATTIIATDIAEYLAAKREGTFGTNIFVDLQPDKPDEAITIFDIGGTDPREPPEMWRQLYIQVRCKTHSTGYEKIWRVLNYVLCPTGGLITVGSNSYTAQLEEIPSIYDRDQTKRYLFGFRVTVYKVSGTITDTWLNALVDWTETVLGIGWTVASVWPGNLRPSVIWSLSGIQTSDGRGSTIRLHKKFTANILGNTPNDSMSGAVSIVSGLKAAIKIVLDDENKRYLTVEDPRADFQGNSLTKSQVTVTLSRSVKQVSGELPLINGVTTMGNIE